MRSRIVSFFKGSIRAEIYGQHPEALLNKCTEAGISPWDVSIHNKTLRLCMHVRDFFRLRPLLKETGCRIRVRERKGFPFYLNRLEKRKTFAFGLLFFFIGLYMLSSIVWSIRVTGNESIPTEDVLQAASKHGVHVLQWKFNLQEPAKLAQELMNDLPGTAWVGVEIKGTQIHIQLVEAVDPEDKTLYSPRHLISTSDAVVTEIFTEQGKPMVQPNTAVKKGQILISGIIGNEEVPEDQAAVTAKGVVKGLVLYEYKIEIPLTLQYKIYTGNSFTRKYLVLGNRGLQVTGYGQDDYEQSESMIKQSYIHWRHFKLPIGWQDEKVMETDIVQQELTVEEAKSIAMQQAASEALMIAGEDSTITEQKILQESTDNGKVYIHALFEINQHITAEKVLIPDSIYRGE